MRTWWLVVVALASGCTALLGIDDFDEPPSDCVGVCECKVDDDCPLSTYCNDTGVDRTCDCVAGFTRAADDETCTWSGVLPDPELDDDGGWTMTRAQFVTVQSPMMNEKALVILDAVAHADRTIEMPRLARSGALVVELSYLGTDMLGQHRPIIPTGPAFALGARWHDRYVNGPVFSPVQTSRFCLGDKHYAPATSSGRGVEVPFSLGIDISSPENLFELVGFTRAVIVPAGPNECAVPGTIANGDAETDEVWMFRPSAGGVVEYQPEVGENGSRGIQLRNTQRCGQSAIAGSISIPATGGTALRYYEATSTTGTIAVTLDGSRYATAGTAEPVVHVHCLYPHHRGTAREIGASVTGASGGTCDDALISAAIVDSFAIVEEPSCGPASEITSPGYESPYFSPSTSATAARGSARVIEDAALARSGSHAVELRETKTCSNAVVSHPVIIPPSSEEGGPAVAFWYRGAGPLVANGLALNARDQWLRGVACVDPARANRNGALTVRIPTSSTCDTTVDRTVYIDDLEVISDPACPK